MSSCSRIISSAPKSQAPLRHYCIVRSDLPVGVQAAQLVHAAGESSPGNLPEGTYAVALHARSEQELHRVAFLLTHAKLGFVAVRESDPPYCGQLMAVGVRPVPPNSPECAELRRLLSALPLVKSAAEASRECEHRVPKTGFCYDCNGGLPSSRRNGVPGAQVPGRQVQDLPTPPNGRVPQTAEDPE